MQLLDRINRTGTTVVVATHDEVSSTRCAVVIIELSNGAMGATRKRGVYGFDGAAQERVDVAAGGMG